MIRRILITLITLSVCLLSAAVQPCYSVGTMDSSLNDLSAQIVSELTGGQKHKIAVLAFSNLDGRSSEFGGFIAEELITRLFKTRRVDVVERQFLDKILMEQKLNLVGIIDETTAKKIGKILGVDAVCSGTITDLGDTLKINARLISTETGAIFAVASTEMLNDEKVKYLAGHVKFARRTVTDSGTSFKYPISPNDYIFNGGFTKRYEGWEKQVGDITQGSSKSEIISFPNGLSGKALHIKHGGNGSLQFSQMMDVSSPDLLFAASFQASSHEGSVIGFTGSGVSQIALQYINEDGNLIGQTILLNYVKNPFADTPLIGVPRRARDTYKSHYIEFQNGKLYSNYKIDIRHEIEDNLIGVDIASLRKIAVVIWCGANHPQAGSEMWITDVSMRAK